MNTQEEILYKMLLCRRVDEEIIARYSKQLMRCPTHLSCGQEAIAVGVCHNLRKEDKIFSTHRNHSHYLAHGGSLEKMALELHGKVGGCMDGRGGSMHLSDTNIISIPIVASSIPLAVGAALAEKIDKTGNIVVCFFGDAAVEEGVFHESLNFASLMQLPIIFVCENNGYSVDTDIKKRQPKRELMKLARAHKIQSINDESGNVKYLANLFQIVIQRCRENSEPIFAVLNTGRSHVHCGTAEEFKLKTDPLKLAIGRKNIKKLDAEIKARICKAFDAAEAAPLPTPVMAERYVYA